MTTTPAPAPTIAEQIGALLDKDGRRFTTLDGRDLRDLLADYPHAAA